MLSKKFLEQEIENSNIAIKKLEEGLAVHRIVLAAFEEQLKNAK